MIEQFLGLLLSDRIYTPETVFIYVSAGVMAGLTRLIIRDGNHARFHLWWTDGSLLGAIIVSVIGAILVDNSFVWAFLGGYFITYVLEYIQKGLDKVIKK